MSTTPRSNAVDDVTPLSMDVIDAIAAEEGVDPVDLDTPLYEVIDLDAVDDLVTGPSETTIEINFRYEGYDVVVTNEREIRVEGHGE